jgi:hypothetical protein
MDASKQLDKLFEELLEKIALAQQLDLPGNDLAMKMAIVGYSVNSPVHSWRASHAQFVNQRLEREYSVNALQEFGDEAASIRLFVYLCQGYLLGLYETEKLTDVQFAVAEAQIPGLVFLHSGRFLKL